MGCPSLAAAPLVLPKCGKIKAGGKAKTLWPIGKNAAAVLPCPRQLCCGVWGRGQGNCAAALAKAGRAKTLRRLAKGAGQLCCGVWAGAYASGAWLAVSGNAAVRRVAAVRHCRRGMAGAEVTD